MKCVKTEEVNKQAQMKLDAKQFNYIVCFYTWLTIAALEYVCFNPITVLIYNY